DYYCMVWHNNGWLF
nr:immunoglobulin light chain junction region [Macaca mulatta]MOY05646.1 immunoglobulin light chain junction region [Macaca mulatta]MOY05647.1 immunoglobulin light chain junction region [Macaca mulatta]MOY05690.1 immunoglobulin light chain junction region [Macaca mulatta]MOY05742.1 immunoglobulin light chain junction region [Macaca mulatta]